MVVICCTWAGLKDDVTSMRLLAFYLLNVIAQSYLEKEMLVTLNAGFNSEKINKNIVDFIVIFRL